MTGDILVVTSWEEEGVQLASVGWKPGRHSSAEVELLPLLPIPGTQRSSC